MGHPVRYLAFAIDNGPHPSLNIQIYVRDVFRIGEKLIQELIRFNFSAYIVEEASNLSNKLKTMPQVIHTTALSSSGYPMSLLFLFKLLYTGYLDIPGLLFPSNL